jgi:hypothetical protein
MNLQDPESRYEALVEVALASEELWSLEAEGALIRFKLQDGMTALPLWPSQESAALQAADASEQPRRISLEELLEKILPEIGRQNGVVAAFPLDGAARILQAQELSQRIEREWDEDDG